MSNFSENLLSLRKENGLTQKKVAQDLGVSQALLSHYEKGIRECSQEFLLKISDYFSVSCDYLLGSNYANTLEKNHIPQTIEEKVILNSLEILYSVLKNSHNKTLIKECTNYMCTAVYTLIRHVTSNHDVYKLDKELFSAISSSNMTMCKAKIKRILISEDMADNLPTLVLKDGSENTELFKNLVSIAEQDV